MRKRSKNNRTKIAQLRFKFSDLFAADNKIITTLLILLPLLIYAQVWGFSFVWDDGDGGRTVGGHLQNTFVLDASWQSFWQLFTQPYFGMYIPIGYLFLGLLKSLVQLFSLPVYGILHLGNVAVHIVNGLLVFTILRQFIDNKWAVALGAGFFLLHPVQVEAVAWISGFRDLLATLFTLLSLYHYFKKPNDMSYLSLIFFILAVLSKPSAVVLVPILFLSNHFHFGLKFVENFIKTLPYIFIALLTAAVAYSVQSNYADFSPYTIAVWQRPFAWLDSIVFYVFKIIYPYHLSASYTLSPKFISAAWWFYPLAILPLFLGYWLWLKRKTERLVVFAVALFIAGFFTTSGFVSFSFQKYSLVADRYLYFAMLGVALFVAAIISKADKKQFGIWAAAIILLIFATLSAFRQIPIWKNSLILWSHSVNYEVNPAYSHINLGTYFNNTGLRITDTKDAIKHFDKAIVYYSKEPTNKSLGNSFYNKGNVLVKQKKYQQAEDYFDKSIKFFAQRRAKMPSYNKSFYNRGVVRFKQDKLALAYQDFERTIKTEPKNQQAQHNMIFINIKLKQCKKAHQVKKFADKNNIKIPQSLSQELKSKCPSK